MRSVNRVLFDCFTAPLWISAADASGLSVGEQVAVQTDIHCARYLTDFCLMAQCHSHTTLTMAYMDQDLQKFHDSVEVFYEFRATKQNRQDAKEASRKLASGQLEARQPRLHVRCCEWLADKCQNLLMNTHCNCHFGKQLAGQAIFLLLHVRDMKYKVSAKPIVEAALSKMIARMNSMFLF